MISYDSIKYKNYILETSGWNVLPTRINSSLPVTICKQFFIVQWKHVSPCFAFNQNTNQIGTFVVGNINNVY